MRRTLHRVSDRRFIVLAITRLTALLATYLAGRMWLDRSPRHPSEWLTERDQEQLADALTLVGDGSGWIAGCIWEDRDEHVADVVTVPGDATRHRATTATGRAMTFARVEGIAVSGSYAEVEGPGFSCWVPTP